MMWTNNDEAILGKIRQPAFFVVVFSVQFLSHCCSEENELAPNGFQQLWKRKLLNAATLTNKKKLNPNKAEF